MESSGESVHALLKDLTIAHYYPNKKGISVTSRHSMRNARKLCYERLLSHRGGSREWQRLGFSVFDRLLVKSYEKKIENDSESADRLNSYVTTLRTNCSEDCSNVLRLLLELAESGEEGSKTDGSHLASIRKGTKTITKLINVTKKHSYEQFSRFLFEDTEDLTRHRSVFKGFDSKLFELCPGFVSSTQRLSCNSYPSLLQDTVAPSLFGALSHPLKDPWRLDARLEFPELTDESPSLLVSDLRNFVQLEVPSKMEFKSQTPLDEDEGFVETMTDTPSSVRSFRCVAAVDNKIDVFSIILEDELGCRSTRERYATWETFGCYCPPLEKPLLTEAGPKAFDEVLLCYQHEMSIIHPDLLSIMPKSTIISVADLFRDAINVLVGVSSKTFVYEPAKELFVLANVTISGLSLMAVSELLLDFAECGTAFRKLESKCKGNVKANSLVQRAFCNAVDCYLYCYQTSIFAVKDRNTGTDLQLKLLHLGESSSKLRAQLRVVTKMVFFDKNGTILPKDFPVGVELLRHLYDAVQSCGVDEDRSVFLSFLIAASEPYIRYLCLWAFEGQLFDPYDEFPIVENIEAHQGCDEIFWKESFALTDVCDPLLGDALNGVFTCGKSLHLLRLCCPKHTLMASCDLSPSINIVFSEEKQEKQRDHNVRYYNMMKSKVENLALNRELKKLLLEKDKEELLRRAQQEAQNTLVKLERKRIHRLELERAKKRTILAELKVQIELHSKKKEADRQNILNERGFAREKKDLNVEPDDSTNTKTLMSQSESDLTEEPNENVDDSKSTTSEQQLVSSSEESPDLYSVVDLNSVTRDSNMNLLQESTSVEAIGDILDSNANLEDEHVEKSDVVLRTKDILSSHTKGIKRKQDRDSIDFEVGGVPRRPPKTEQGVLVEGSTFMVLRSRGRGAHGHASDSTIQKLIYGGVTAVSIIDSKPSSDAVVVNNEYGNGSLHLKNAKCFTNSKVQPYTIEFPELDKPPMADIFTQSKVDDSDCGDDVSLTSLFRQPLSIILNQCLVIPLQAQMRCVDSCLLDFFFTNLKAEEHLSALRDYFFMQNGEFAQMLCDLLFERLATCSSPRKLLNPVVFNSILSRAVALSSPNSYSDNLGFVVKYLPKTFHPNSPSSLNCVRLSYRVDWPLNLLISSEILGSYERIFSFILQIRRCSWSLTNLYSVLKDSDKQHGLTSSVQFRRIQFFRHEMQHFIRSLYEYVGIQAFQVTWFKFQEALGWIKNLEQLLEIHSKYLRQILFRCLLHNKGTPIMKIVQDIFSIILKFCSRLSSDRWKRNSTSGSMEVECFPQIQSSFKAFQEHATFLYKVISKLVQRGFQTHLGELLLSLDFNDYYSSLASQLPDVSCPSSLLSSTDNSFKSLS